MLARLALDVFDHVISLRLNLTAHRNRELDHLARTLLILFDHADHRRLARQHLVFDGAVHVLIVLQLLKLLVSGHLKQRHLRLLKCRFGELKENWLVCEWVLLAIKSCADHFELLN
jgi:hypothetical protein